MSHFSNSLAVTNGNQNNRGWRFEGKTWLLLFMESMTFALNLGKDLFTWTSCKATCKVQGHFDPRHPRAFERSDLYTAKIVINHAGAFET